MNRGKRAITLDLTVPDGVALAKALIKGADAVIENYSADVLRKFGLDYAELVKVNPSRLRDAARRKIESRRQSPPGQ